MDFHHNLKSEEGFKSWKAYKVGKTVKVLVSQSCPTLVTL